MAGNNNSEYLDSKTTDSEGKATLKTTIATSGDHTYHIYKNTTQLDTPITINAVEVSDIELTSYEPVISEGISTTIQAIVLKNASTSTVGGIHIKIDGEDYITGSGGKAFHQLTGTGEGSRTITAQCGSKTATITVDDVLMYLSKSLNKNFNFRYDKSASLSVVEKYNGLQLTSATSSNGTINFNHSSLGIDIPWQCEFDVISADPNSLKVQGVDIANIYLQNKCHITVKSEGFRQKKVWVNDTLIVSTTSSTTQTGYPELYISASKSVIIDNIEVMIV